MISQRYAPFLFGGGEISVGGFARGLVSIGNEVTVISTHDYHQISTETLDGVRVIRLPNKNVYWENPTVKRPKYLKMIWHALDLWNPAVIGPLSRIIEQEKPHVLQTHALEGISVAAWNVAHSMRIPLSHYLHSFYLMCPKATMFKNYENCRGQCMGCKLFTKPRRWSSKAIRGLISNSEFTLQRHLDAGYFPNALVKRVIHGSCKPSVASSAPKLVGTKIRLGFLGRLDPSKGLEWLIEELKSLEQDTWSLCVAGTGSRDYEDYLRSVASGKPIEFLGHRLPQELFAKIDLLVVPSLWHEPQGRVIFEAFANAVPVAVSSMGGMPELVVEGKTGFIFQLKHGELARKISTWSRDPSKVKEMRRLAHEKSFLFEEKTIAHDMQSFFQELTQVAPENNLYNPLKR